MSRLTGKVTYVTGVASGIGLACAQRFAAEGAVVIGADLNTTDEWADAIAAAPASGFHVLDVRDEAAQMEVARSIVADHGRIDAVVTAAGIAGRRIRGRSLLRPGADPLRLTPEHESHILGVHSMPWYATWNSPAVLRVTTPGAPSRRST